MEVIQSIRELLYLEDCVIIPGMGGFVSSYRPAVVEKATGTFIPPAKEIVFNADLVQNDGTLTGFISQKNGISTDAARQLIDRFVEDSMIKLNKGQPVFIAGMGQFILENKSRRIRFQADSGTGSFLEYFGLASFHLREVDHEEPSKIIEFPVNKIKKAHNHLIIRRIAIAVPILIAFSLLPYHSRMADTFRPSPVSMIPEPSLFRLNYPGTPHRDTARVIEFPLLEDANKKQVTSDIVTSDNGNQEALNREEPKAAVGKFPVIAGCFKIKSNAERLQKQLIEKGYPASIINSRNGLFYKVGIQIFTTRQEALDGLARLRSAEPGMELWVAL